MIRRGFSLLAMVVMALGAVVSAGAQSSGQAASGVGVAGSAAAARGQTNATGRSGGTVPAQAPKDAKALMELAARTNGLAGLNDRPWHVKFMYQTYDGDGKPGHIGILEEWWVSATKYKYVYSDPDYSHTVYRNGKIYMVAGDQDPPPVPVSFIEGYLWTPLPSATAVAKPFYLVKQRKFGHVLLTCMQSYNVDPKLRGWAAVTATQVEIAKPMIPTTCFSDGPLAIRVEVTKTNLIAVFNRIVEVDGHFVAKQIGLNDVNLPVATLNVMQLDFPKSIPDAAMAAPTGPSAKTLPLPDAEAGVKHKVVPGHRIHGGDLHDYPMAAVEQHISGLVILTGYINADGSVTDVKAVLGPSALRDAALRTVKTWRYTPYLVDGKPTRVRTQFAFNFNF